MSIRGLPASLPASVSLGSTHCNPKQTGTYQVVDSGPMGAYPTQPVAVIDAQNSRSGAHLTGLLVVIGHGGRVGVSLHIHSQVIGHSENTLGIKELSRRVTSPWFKDCATLSKKTYVNEAKLVGGINARIFIHHIVIGLAYGSLGV